MTLLTIYAINFLIYSDDRWTINQGNSPDIGLWCLTGYNKGTIVKNSGKSVIQYLKYLQGQGCKVIVSFIGGGVSQAQMNSMLANPVDTANSICYALLSRSSGTNPLGFAKQNTPWEDFAFDGIDVNIETNTPLPSDQFILIEQIRKNLPDTLITSSPQVSHIFASHSAGCNGNGTWGTFKSIYPYTKLSQYPHSISDSALLYPPLLAKSGLDYLFVQLYNQHASWYPGHSPSYFTAALAVWGYLCLLSHTTLGTGCKLILGFSTADGRPLWDQDKDGAALNIAIPSANAKIVAVSDTFADVTPSMWLAGWGSWNSPSGNAVAAHIFSPAGNIPNLPGIAVQLYARQSRSPSYPGWDGPIIDTREKV